MSPHSIRGPKKSEESSDSKQDQSHETSLTRLETEKAKNRQTNMNLIFIWIPKNAGSTVYATLHKEIGMQRCKYLKNEVITSGVNTFGHQSLGKLIKNGNISKKYASESPKFAITRCPYQRAVSLYCYLKNKALTRFSRNPFHETPTFLNYLKILDKRGFKPLGTGRVHWRQFSSPQSHWIYDHPIDSLIPIHELEQHLADIIDIYSPNPAQPNLINKNRRENRAWQDFYCEESKHLVETLYACDFKLISTFPYKEFNVPKKRENLLPEEEEIPLRLKNRLKKIYNF